MDDVDLCIIVLCRAIVWRVVYVGIVWVIHSLPVVYVLRVIVGVGDVWKTHMREHFLHR